MKKELIKPLLGKGLHIITKARGDANLKYLFKGRRKNGKGRPKLYDGKVNTEAIDKRKIQCCYRAKAVSVYAGVVYAVQLKQTVLAAFVYCAGKEKAETLSAPTRKGVPSPCVSIYGLRFQVEFLIRDAKQHAGLEESQARDQQKLNNHFNTAMSVVSLAKAIYYLSIPAEQRGSFSINDIKMLHMNQLITNRIFTNLDVDLKSQKIKRLYNQCLNFGRLRA